MQVPHTLEQLALKTRRQYSSVSHRVGRRLRRAFHSLDRPDSSWTRFWITMDLIVIRCDSPMLLRAIRPLYKVREQRIPHRRSFVLASPVYGQRYVIAKTLSFLETCPSKLSWELVKQSRRYAKGLHELIQACPAHESSLRCIQLLAYATVTRSPR
jgi:hypothetical protein